MRKILYILFLGCLFGLSSCTDLDVRNKSSIEDPWSSSEAGTLYMNSLYKNSLPSSGFGGNANFTEESDGANNTVQGRLEEGSIGNFDLLTYNRIRYINIGIKGCEESSLPQKVKEEFIAQMCFLRAYEYFELTKLYGGVPIVLEAQQPTGNAADLNLPRKTAKECFEYILADLDYATKYCPDTWGDSERGRVSKSVAAAFRGRVYLTFASPLFNPQNDQTRWESAYQACLEAKTICKARNRGLNSVFGNMFLEEGFSNSEVVWVVPYDVAAGKSHGWEDAIRPESMSAARGTKTTYVPTKNLIDAFPMKDGKKISEQGAYSYNLQYYWKNRDPRLSSTVVYNGAVWNLNGASKRFQWIYQGMSGENRIYMVSLGNYCRKASNPAIMNSTSGSETTKTTSVDWIELRYAEVLLNLAECANEAGHSSDAYAELYEIRKRAGIDVGDGGYGISAGLAKESLREVIMNERLLEFAYENKRYWDLRRRLMYTESLGSNTPSFNSKLNRYTYVVNPNSPYTAAQIDAIRDNINVDTESSTYFKIVETKRDIQYPLNYQKKYYFFDIPLNILQRCIDVQQTIGWVDGRLSTPGTFDPLSDQGGTPWKGELQ